MTRFTDKRGETAPTRSRTRPKRARAAWRAAANAPNRRSDVTTTRRSQISRNVQARRFAATASALVIATVPFTAGVQSASALPGYEVVTVESEASSRQTRSTQARCPTGKRLVGGGGVAVGAFLSMIPTLTLTELRPVKRPTSQGKDKYVVSAAETGAGTSATWVLKAYAVCVDATAIGPWSIKEHTTVRSSSSVKSTATVCPPGRRVLGTGARINHRSNGEIFIQMARPSRPGDIARAQGHEDANGYGGFWSVTAYAICAPPPNGYIIPPFGHSVPIGALPTGSDPQVIAAVRCPENRKLLSAGAALGEDASGRVSLQGMYPGGGFGSSQALAAESTPTDEKWGFMVASSICAY